MPEHFVLYGWTGLALHLGHRSSDFDFFADRDIEPGELLQDLAFLTGAEITQQEPNTLSCIVDRGGPIRLSFFGLPRLGRLRSPFVCRETGVRVAALLDIAATKAAVVQRRAEAKDYIDIDALIRHHRPALLGLLECDDRRYPTPPMPVRRFFDDASAVDTPLKSPDHEAGR